MFLNVFIVFGVNRLRKKLFNMVYIFIYIFESPKFLGEKNIYLCTNIHIVKSGELSNKNRFISHLLSLNKGNNKVFFFTDVIKVLVNVNV